MAKEAFPKRELLVSKLVEKSRDDELSWEEGTGKDSVFVSFKTSSVTILKGRAWNNDICYTFVVRDAAGETVDRFDADDLSRVTIGQVSELYEKAWRQVKEADKTIDDILKELE